MKKINKTNAIYLGIALMGILLTIGNALYSIANNMYALSDLAADVLYFIGICMFIEVLYLGTKKEN